MPVIREEGEGFANADFDQVLDLPGTAFSGFHDAITATLPDGDISLLDTALDYWDLPLPLDGAAGLAAEPDYSRFDHFIPRFHWPEKPCDYCRSRKLNCYLQRGEQNCTPCLSLFRECSLTNSHTLEASNYTDRATGTFLDTLHTVDEDAAKEHGMPTGIKLLKSKSGRAGAATTLLNNEDDEPGSTKRNGIRFPRHAVKILRDWLDGHMENPYPTEEEKMELERQTDLKPNQIANWLANARRRNKVAERTRPKRSMSPSLGPTTRPILIPSSSKPWDELNPLERWKHSPPEHEPASIIDIAQAVATSDLADGISSPSSSIRRKKRSSNGSGVSKSRAPSSTSLDTSAAQSSSMSASSAAFSRGSSQSRGSFGSFSSGLQGKRDRRRRRRAPPLLSTRSSDQAKRVFQCTFCTDSFKSKYDWTRHEKSLHLSLEKWICAPLGPVITDAETGKIKCVYCEAHNPSDNHIENAHNHRECEERGRDARTFYRKDHLRQHMRLMHGCEMKPSMDAWGSTTVNINSRCGFCAQRFSVWQERVDHLTAHFKAGARMSDWKGCRGFDPAVAAQVTNAMPPYLIGNESVSLNPFSATDRTSGGCSGLLTTPDDKDDLYGLITEGLPDSSSTPYGSRGTCWEILTVRLGNFATQAARSGIIMTDEMLQQQARHILFDSDDTWNQTAADNPEWLDLFKKAHGLDFIPDDIGGQGPSIPEDLETYSDLGLRIPFAIQLQAHNRTQAGKLQMRNSTNVPGNFKAVLDKRRETYRDMYAQLAREGVLHDETHSCEHDECAKNIIDISVIDGAGTAGPVYQRWCQREILTSSKTHMPEVKMLQELEQRLVDVEGCQGQEHDAQSDAACARARGLRALSQSEAERCSFAEINERHHASTARARGLGALNALEVPMSHGEGCCHMCGNQNTSALAPTQRPASDLGGDAVGKSALLPRHRYQLPRDKAAIFATTTGAWEDSGLMPPPVSTASAANTAMSSMEEMPTTTTGATTEFLSDTNLSGLDLMFINDDATSRIPLPASEQTALDLAMLDELIAATAAQEGQDVELTAPAFSGAARMAELMEGVEFGEMDFDSVFDMPADETFGVGVESL